MLWPEALGRGSRVALVAPARRVSPPDIQPFVEFCQGQGWQVLYEPESLFLHDGFFAGSDAHRLKVLQEALDDERIQAVWVARGGHGLSRIWPRLNWEGFRRRPRWIIGFSDATPLLWGAVHQGVVAVHGPVAVQVPHRLSVEALRWLLGLLRGEPLMPLRWKRYPWHAWKAGYAEGHLMGGNLSLLATLADTDLSYTRFEKPALLFWEEVGEYHYRLDRLLWHLYNAGWLEKSRGLLVGSFTGLLDDEDQPFSRTPGEMIAEVSAAHPGPVVMGLPIGHIRSNFALPVGAWTSLQASEEEATLSFEHP